MIMLYGYSELGLSVKVAEGRKVHVSSKDRDPNIVVKGQ